MWHFKSCRADVTGIASALLRSYSLLRPCKVSKVSNMSTSVLALSLHSSHSGTVRHLCYARLLRRNMCSLLLDCGALCLPAVWGMSNLGRSPIASEELESFLRKEAGSESGLNPRKKQRSAVRIFVKSPGDATRHFLAFQQPPRVVGRFHARRSSPNLAMPTLSQKPLEDPDR